MLYNFKSITVVPSAKDFIDIVLSKTQRKTPTVVHPGYQISRIRQFYMRKVKYASQTIHDRLTTILDEYPTLDDIHPFYADLMNVLYDRDHYKLALGHISRARTMVDNIGKDYNKLLKYGDSLYRCKQLKRAALGRMCTLLKKLVSSLSYLEEVRQHLARLPAIDPNTRTLLICGYPNVGKSSFMNTLTRAEVDVQPYAFTTKSLFVGHTDYQYLRWQVIDTPGILDHPLEERNTIEMQSITALAHLRAAVIYIIDPSEQCGFTLSEQVSLFQSIKPLFANKPLLVVANKTDVKRVSDLSADERKLVDSMLTGGVEFLEMSTHKQDGVSDVKQKACDKLLQHRVEIKLKAKKINDALNRLHTAQPQPRDDRSRPAMIPPSVLAKRQQMAEDRANAAADDEVEPMDEEVEVPLWLKNFGNKEWKKRYQLANDDWKFDKVPEIIDGQNIADFIDPDILEKLEELEREEELLLEKERAEDAEREPEPELSGEQKALVEEIRNKKAMLRQKHHLEKGFRNHPALPSKHQSLSMDDVESHLLDMGIDPEAVERVRSRSRSRSESRVGRKRTRSESRGDDTELEQRAKKMRRSVSRTPSRGLGTVEQVDTARYLNKQAFKLRNSEARKGEGDRHVYDLKPKHLYTGKRTIGKTDRR